MLFSECQAKSFTTNQLARTSPFGVKLRGPLFKNNENFSGTSVLKVMTKLNRLKNRVTDAGTAVE
jgi:hypothetical protein